MPNLLINQRVKTLIIMLFVTFSIDNVFSAGTSTIAEGSSTIADGSLTNSFSSWGSPSLQGDWQIVKSDDKIFIELADNFKAKEGPDVKIFLSPLAAKDINGDNASQDSLFISLVTKFEGQTRIEIPTGTDLSQYQSLVFHCEAYSKLWGSSPL